jgi:hypothetical protein
MVTKIWLQLYFIVLASAHPAVGQPVSDPARIEVYITPYNNSEGPVVEIGRFGKGLAAKDEPEFVETILQMKQSWRELRFPEMYVAAIRFTTLVSETNRATGFTQLNIAAVCSRVWSIKKRWEAWVHPPSSWSRQRIFSAAGGAIHQWLCIWRYRSPRPNR